MTNDKFLRQCSVTKTFVIRHLSFVILSALILSSNVKAQDTTKVDTAGFHMTKSPLKAIVLSALIPGAGQAYLDQWWKVPVIWGIGGAFLYGALKQDYRYHVMQDSVNNALARQKPLDTLWANTYASSREFYRDDRDKWWIYVGLTYLANILDAYIASHLYDFDVSTPPSASRVAPIGTYYDPYRKEVGLTFRLTY
jgi:hypothetical protein